MADKDRVKLDKTEASGLFSAARFVKYLVKKQTRIDIGVVYHLHSLIFRRSQPVIAGKLRLCEFKKLYHHLPPPASQVPGLMLEFSKDLEEKIKILRNRKNESENIKINKIISTAAWASHKISYIHPFADGNGRTARLVINLILEKYDLPPIIITSEIRNKYLASLAQIDEQNDYKPLIKIIAEGIEEYYNRLEKKKLVYLKAKHKKAS